MFGRVKDGMIGIGLKKFVNEKFGEYGEIQDADVDTGSRKVNLKVLLKGEQFPVTASIDRYDIEREGEDVYIKLLAFSASRAWLSTILNKFLIGKRFKLPSAVAGML